LPPELIDAIRLLASRHGFKGEEHLFLFFLLKSNHPDEMAQIIQLFDLGWMDEQDPSD